MDGSLQKFAMEIWLTVFLTIFGIIAPIVWNRFQRKKMRQAEMFYRESHNLRLFRALSDTNQRLQMAAAAVLVERLRQMARSELEERRTIIRALISVTKSSPAHGR